jgi:thiol-disulfide isomerase/thioredoxin
MPLRLNARNAAVLALVAALAGAGAIYGIGGGKGNAIACGNSFGKAAELAGLMRGDMAAMRPVRQPVAVGELAFNDDAGRRHTLGSLAGKALLLNLWATWCPPCRAEMPALDALQKEMGGRRFEVVAVSVDLGSPDKPKRFYAETGIASLAFRHDGTMEIFNRLKRAGLGLGMPVSVLVDAEGCAVGVLNGPAEWASPAAIALMGALAK